MREEKLGGTPGEFLLIKNVAIGQQEQQLRRTEPISTPLLFK